MTHTNLCDSCTNIGCEFQSGIVRTKCAFYMPPHTESDNCENCVVIPPTAEAILDQIRAEIERIGGDDEKAFCKNLNESYKQGLKDALKVIDKYKAESEGKE